MFTVHQLSCHGNLFSAVSMCQGKMDWVSQHCNQRHPNAGNTLSQFIFIPSKDTCGPNVTRIIAANFGNVGEVLLSTGMLWYYPLLAAHGGGYGVFT